jgi:hypothetical protein
MKLKLLLLPIFLLGVLRVDACPTCVSSSDGYTPPFFSDDYYQPRKMNYDDQETDTDEGEDYEEVYDSADIVTE